MPPQPSFPEPLSHSASGFQSSVRHPHLGLWWLNLWRRLWGFILELRWSWRSVPKMTLDIWYLKMILMEFRISMPTEFTPVLMQLTCHSHNVTTAPYTAVSRSCTWLKERQSSFYSQWLTDQLRLVPSKLTEQFPKPLEGSVILDQFCPAELFAMMEEFCPVQHGSY